MKRKRIIRTVIIVLAALLLLFPKRTLYKLSLIHILHKLSCELLGLPADAREVPAKNVKKLCKMIRDKEFFYQTVYRIVPERIFSIQPGLMILREVANWKTRLLLKCSYIYPVSFRYNTAGKMIFRT